MFFATYVLQKRGVDLNDILGLHYFEADKFRPYQFITYMFMHGSLGHIFFNMFALWMFGSAIENTWGPKRFLTFYILTGLGAAIAHYLIVYFEMHPAIAVMDQFLANPTTGHLGAMLQSESFRNLTSPDIVSQLGALSDAHGSDQGQAIPVAVDFISQLRTQLLNAPVVIGASGAIFGLLLAYGMTFPNNVIYIYFALPIKAKYFVILYGLLEFFTGIAQASGDNVAHFAHLGGLVTGLIIILYWRNRHKWRKF
ncbi:MAG: rhomboid family intramembrane serine protease [Bacteroidia bacterium]|nr:rhomboid family intramembrane serine protease [Bacteroidia bacterium]